MCIIGMPCHRRGTSTIYGVIIFVGIMFTAVIPMFLVMNQADTLYEMRKVEVGRLDEERAIENIFFNLETSIDPVTEEPIITLVFYNRCVIAVKIIHVWINGELREVDYLIPPTSDGELELRNVVDPQTTDPVSFSVRVVTDNGNIFLSSYGNPEYSYDPELGGNWEHDVYIIYILMTNKRPQLHILVNNTHDYEEILIEPPITYFDEGVENNLDGYWIGVPHAGYYRIVVTQFQDTTLFDETRRLGPSNLATLVII